MARGDHRANNETKDDTNSLFLYNTSNQKLNGAWEGLRMRLLKSQPHYSPVLTLSAQHHYNSTLTVLTQNYAPFDYKPSLTILQKIVAEVYLSPIYAPLDHACMEIHNKNGRTPTNKGKVNIPPYIEFSYLLASDIPTK